MLDSTVRQRHRSLRLSEKTKAQIGQFKLHAKTNGCYGKPGSRSWCTHLLNKLHKRRENEIVTMCDINRWILKHSWIADKNCLSPPLRRRRSQGGNKSSTGNETRVWRRQEDTDPLEINQHNAQEQEIESSERIATSAGLFAPNVRDTSYEDRNSVIQSDTMPSSGVQELIVGDLPGLNESQNFQNLYQLNQQQQSICHEQDGFSNNRQQRDGSPVLLQIERVVQNSIQQHKYSDDLLKDLNEGLSHVGKLNRLYQKYPDVFSRCILPIDQILKFMNKIQIECLQGPGHRSAVAAAIIVEQIQTKRERFVVQISDDEDQI